MTTDQIREKAERSGGKLDMRTVIVDIEGRLGRPMNADEHAAFVVGWQKTAAARAERYHREAKAAADGARQP